MAEHSKPVRLVLDDNFTAPLAAAASAARALNVALAKNAATWEPHDWSEWED